MREISASVPARINILGNPSDGLEGDWHTISAAIELRAGAWVEPSDVLQFDEYARNAEGRLQLRQSVRDVEMALTPGGGAELQKAALRRLLAYSPEFAARVRQQKLRLATWTDVPRQSGLGGSSLLVLLTLAAMREAFDLDRRLHNDYVLAELTQRTEAMELGITCGYADRYVPLFGGLAFIDYRGKLMQRPLDEEPYCTYERLDGYVSELPLVACSTGLARDSGEVHAVMRARYLEEHQAYERSRGARTRLPFMLRVMAQVGATAWKGKIALLRGDWRAFGALMNENHRLVNDMMAYCGLDSAGVVATNRLIEAALDAGALGAKLTGAGGGGSVFALVQPGQEARMAEVLGQAARDLGLDQATVFVPRLARQGLVVEEGQRAP
ncbi:MAG: hypothetical protein QME94_09820 [Anaerolineae bacterium]|nr:hypothetical protein [Anaerolineae bacterium]